MTEHLITSTITALVALAAAALLRNRSAKFRFAICLLGLLRFAVPTAWLDSAGDTLAHRVPAYIDTGVTSLPGMPILLGALPAAPASDNVPYANIAFAIWIAGALLCLVLSARRWFPRLPAVRPATPAESAAVYRVWDRLHIRQRVDVRIVAADEVPAACGVFRPFIALPDGLAGALSPAELDAVVAHELAHVVRRDNLSAALVRLIVATFWFHPLVWWIEHRLLVERETACDEFVLANGATRQDYVTGIAKVCRIAFAGPPAFAGITGANLKSRAAHILSVDLRGVFSGPARWAPMVFGILAVLAPMTVGFLAAQPPTETRVQIAIEQGKIDDAIALLEQELDRRPTDSNLRLTLASLYVRASRYDAAIGLFEQLLFEQPNSPDILFKLAETYRRAGDLKKALAMFERAADSDPFQPDASLQQALLLDGTGRRDQAKPVYERVLVVDPENAIAANNLAFMIAEEGGDLDRALDLALRAYKKMPASADIADTLGWVYLKHGMPDEAIAAFNTALLRNLDSASVRSHLLRALDLSERTLTPEMQELRVLLRAPVEFQTEQRISSLVRALPQLE